MTAVSQAGLVLTGEQAAQIVRHARAERPSEACGLLAGRDGRVEVIYPLPNAERSPVRYLAEPQAQVDAMLEIESGGLEIVGIYHSHPGSAAYPSPTDIAMAAHPDAVYLIVSLAEGLHPVLRGFRIQDGESQEVELVLNPAASGNLAGVRQRCPHAWGVLASSRDRQPGESCGTRGCTCLT